MLSTRRALWTAGWAGAIVVAGCGRRTSGAGLTIHRDTRDTSALATASSVVDTTPVTIGDLQFRGHNGGLRSRWAPVIVPVTVTITNVGQHSASLNVLGGNCEVLVRLYKHHVPPGRPAFDAAKVGIECYVPLRRIVLDPGASVTLHSAGDGPGVDLPPGQYDLTGMVTIVNPATANVGATVSQRVEVPAGPIRVAQPYE